MLFRDFISTSQELWKEHYAKIRVAEEHRKLVSTIASGLVRRYATMMIFVETPQGFMLELVGTSTEAGPLSTRKHRAVSLDAYLGQLGIRNGPFLFNLQAGSLAHLRFQADDLSQPAVSRRFPQIEELYPTTIVGADMPRSGKLINVDGANFARIEDCLMVHQLESAVRIRHILFGLVVQPSTALAEYKAYLIQYLNDGQVHGMLAVDSERSALMASAAQFSNIYLINGLRETTLGKFLSNNKAILQTAFGAVDIAYERSFKWETSGKGDPTDSPIRPDLFVQRPDGFWDICELKLPLLDKANLTRGERKRRRFIDAVDEGIAQLAHYDYYFKFPENRAYAERNCGMKFRNPKKILIVGNFENINANHIAEASRQLRDEYQVIDYDTIAQLYIAQELGRDIDN